MEGEILLKRKFEEAAPEVEANPLKDLEQKVTDLLKAFQEIKKERDALVSALGMEKEKLTRLERKLEFLSQERENIKLRIDQVLHRLKGTGG